MGIETAFKILLEFLNVALVPDVFPENISTTPKHPDHVEEDDEFPYFCMEYAGEKPEYESSDFRWIQPSREMAVIRLWAVLGQSATESLSIDLIKIVKQIRDVVVEITSNTDNDFRIRVDAVETSYEPSGRWGAAIITVIIGAYGN